VGKVTAYERTRVVVIAAGALFAVSFLTLGVWDLVLIARGQLGGNSASRVIKDFAQAEPVWVFLLGLVLGVLTGHFMWPQVQR
jgi:hypothetical protein